MWPDVIGVSVVFLVSGMFMLGLENTRIFGGLMVAGMLGIVCQISIISWLSGSLDNFHAQEVTLSKSPRQIGTAISCALLSFVYPMENPKRIFGRLIKARRTNGLLICTGIVLFIIVIHTGCLTSLIKSHPEGEDGFVAVPTFHIMEDHNWSKIIPAIACMLVLACSGALMELFPELYKKIVELTQTEWRILARQIGYENSETGSPVLAVFIAGSLCGMTAFACPLENLIYILAGSHLLAAVFRAIYLLYVPFRPKVEEKSSSAENASSLSYSRLDSELTVGGDGVRGVEAATGRPGSSMTLSTSLRKLWNMTKSESNPVNFPKKPKKRVNKNSAEHEEMEREWLLLGEPQSPRLDRGMNGSSGGGGGNEAQSLRSESEIVDTKLIGEGPVISQLGAVNGDEGQEGDESSSSCTDIDAIVYEYREKVRVTTGGPLEANILRIPSASSWRIALFLIGMLFCAVSLLDLGIYQWSYAYLITGTVGVVIVTVLLIFTPQHASQKHEEYQHVTLSVVTLCSTLILMVSTLSQSWPALVFWLLSGLALIVRCDLWCCPCLDQTEEVTIIQDPIFGSAHQLYLTDSQPTLVIGNPLPKGHLIATRLPAR